MSTAIAARTATSGKRWLPGQTVLAVAGLSAFGAPSIDGGTGDVIGLKVEIYLGSLGWIDISPYVYYRDRIHITRGRPDETSQAQPQTATLTINNRDGRFSPRNPVGPYYGLIGRNTPIRISRLNNGIRRYRSTNEVPSWPPTWDITGTDVYIQLAAAGALRRLLQGTQPLRSPMERAMTSGITAANITAYWPCEDAAGSIQLASALSGGTPLAIAGSPTLSRDTTFACSAALPLVNGSSWSAPVPAHPGTTANVLRFLMSIPAAGDSAGEIGFLATNGTVATLQLAYDSLSSGSFEILGKDANGNTLFGTATSGGFNGQLFRISAELIQNGSNITWALVILAPGATVGFILASGSIAGTVGQATSVTINNHIPTAMVGVVGMAIGHVSYQPVWDSLFNLSGAMNAWLGEPPDAVQPNNATYATSRFTRLCLETGVSPVVVTSSAGYDVDPGPASPVGMGNQTIDTLPTLLQQVPDTTTGIIFEPRDQVGVAVRTRASLYNQSPRLTLDYAQHQLSGPLNPVDDDQLTRNDVIVNRVNGSSATQVQTTGPLSVQPPPNGVGDYQTQYQLSLASDSLLVDAAGWRLHMGTVDEPRYPQLMLNLRHSTFTSSVDMMNAALTLDIGDRVVITNPPAWVSPDQISLIVQGYSETLGTYEHDMVITCSPESPYRVAILDDPVLGRPDTDGSTLTRDYPLGTETTLSVTTAGVSTNSPLWTTAAGDFPFDIAVSGERMTVTNITGASSPQTFTVTRSVNGVVKPQTTGADVRLWQPMILSL